MNIKKIYTHRNDKILLSRLKSLFSIGKYTLLQEIFYLSNRMLCKLNKIKLWWIWRKFMLLKSSLNFYFFQCNLSVNKLKFIVKKEISKVQRARYFNSKAISQSQDWPLRITTWWTNQADVKFSLYNYCFRTPNTYDSRSVIRLQHILIYLNLDK